MAIEQLAEQAHQSSRIRVDREAGMIRGVKFIGLESANGRRYPAEVLERARSLYEGKPINLDHNRKSPERSIAHRFGKGINVAITSDGLYGDIACLKKGPNYEHVMEIAESMPELIGLSHTAEGRTRTEKGKTIVEEITSVKSIDLVTDPATTKGLFEGVDGEITIAALIERLQQDAPNDPGVVALAEMANAAPLYAGIGLTPTPEAETEEQVKAAFLAMVVATFKDPNADAKEKLAKIKLILDSQEKLMSTDSKTPTAPKAPTAPAIPESKTPEQLAKLVESTAIEAATKMVQATELESLKESHSKLLAKIALTEAKDESRSLLGKAGIIPVAGKEADYETLVEAVAAQADTAARKKLIEALPKPAPGIGPRSQARTTPIDESKKAPVDLTDPAKVAAFIRGR